MPELPEVETVRRGLSPIVKGSKIIAAKLGNKGLRFPFPFALAHGLEGRSIIDLARRGKYLLFHLDNDKVFLSHLGMSGSWRIQDNLSEAATGKNPLHDHIVLSLQNSELQQAVKLIYNDPRRFGFVDFFALADTKTQPNLCNLGIEPLSDELTVEYLQEAFAKKKAPIKNVLLDQSIVAGLGNIYVCEVLFDIGISPFRPANTLASKDAVNIKLLAAMISSIKAILCKAIEAGGSTLKDHIKTDGSLGYFQHSFAVYGRENADCSRCGGLITRVAMAGRSSFYCSGCQS